MTKKQILVFKFLTLAVGIFAALLEREFVLAWVISLIGLFYVDVSIT